MPYIDATHCPICSAPWGTCLHADPEKIGRFYVSEINREEAHLNELAFRRNAEWRRSLKEV